MIRTNPRGATEYVKQFGGWQNVYNRAQESAGRAALNDAITQLSAGNQGQGLTQQQVMQQIIPIAVKYGIGGDLLGEIAGAFGKAGPGKFDFEHADPEKYTPESFAASWQAQDPTLLRAARPSSPPASAADFTPESIQRWQQSGDIADLRRRPPDRAPAERQPPSGFQWGPGGTLSAIQGGPAAYRSTAEAYAAIPPDQRTPQQQTFLNEYRRMNPLDALLAGALGNRGGTDGATTPSQPATPNAPPTPVAPPQAGQGAQPEQATSRLAHGEESIRLLMTNDGIEERKRRLREAAGR